MGCCAKGRIQNKGRDDAVLLFVLEVTLWRAYWQIKVCPAENNNYGQGVENLSYRKWLKKRGIFSQDKNLWWVWSGRRIEEFKGCHMKWSQRVGAEKKLSRAKPQETFLISGTMYNKDESSSPKRRGIPNSGGTQQKEEGHLSRRIAKWLIIPTKL